MNQTEYLVDNNALIALKSGRVRSKFFGTFCHVTGDVLTEADQNPERAALARNVIEPTPAFLERVRTVMGTVQAGDTQLIDLYKNKGTADPGLIASVLESVAADEGMLFPDTWVLVTNDRAVVVKAAEFGVVTMRSEKLAAIIDASMG